MTKELESVSYQQPYTIAGVTVNRVADRVLFEMVNPQKEEIRLFVGDQPTYPAIRTEFASGKGTHFEGELPRLEGPYYFYGQIGNKKTAIFGERILPLSGAINFRDLGGYTTDTKQVVKWGKLYRGDHLTKLTDDDLKFLEKIGLKSIVDLRSDHERSVYPNRQIETVTQVLSCNPESHFSEVAGKAINLDDENKKLIDDLENGSVDSAVVNGSGSVSKQSYEKLVDDPKSQRAFGTMLKWLANPESIPSVHHCRGGKDRTGFGSMLVLSLLGVPQEQVMTDYLITKQVRLERNLLKLTQYQTLTDNQDYLDYLMALIDTREDYLMAAINRIDDQHGGLIAYVTNELGVTLEEIDRMKELYLEDG